MRYELQIPKLLKIDLSSAIRLPLFVLLFFIKNDLDL